jgi:hypothetical protein
MLPYSAVLGRRDSRMAPGGRMHSESPVRGRRGLAAGVAAPPWLYEDWMYFTIINQSLGDGQGGDTRFGLANGQDYADDGTADEESLIMSEATHDTWGGSPWGIYPGYGAVINNIGGSYLRFEQSYASYPATLVGTQLSWPVDQTLQEQYADYYGYEGADVDYGSPYPFPADFNDAWITGYRVRFYARGALPGALYVQFVSGLPDNTPDYLEADVVVHPKIYIPWTGNDWDSNTYLYSELVFPAATSGLPVAAWAGSHRMRVGVEEVVNASAPSLPGVLDIDQCRVYVDYTIVLP